MKTKICTKCKQEKPISEFHKNKRTKDNLNCWCKQCKFKKDKEWRVSHKYIQKQRHDKYYKEKGHKTARLRLYGVNSTEYDELYALQNGCCAICGTHQSELKRTLGVDHDHTTKQIRGLLCYKCNSGIGFFSDDKELITKALLYLGQYESI